MSVTNSNVFDKSGLIRIEYDRFKGDDKIWGKINDTPILLTDFELQERRTSRSKSGGSKTYYKTLFNGLFLQIDFGKRFIGNTYITPHRKKGKQSTDPIYIKEKPAIAEGFFKSIMNTNTYEIPFIPVKHASFPEMFTLHSTNPPSQLHVINKDLLDYLTKAQQMVDYPLHFSFAQNHVNCVIDMPDTMFEPKIFTSPAKYKEVKFIYDIFLLVEAIVRIFERNKEAWNENNV